ncbi:MAG: hypothetical protein U0354_17085 [Candidatus Sericytochromatia bacterium]
MINYALALRYSGNIKKSIELIDSCDFSSSSMDLKLAYEIIKENYDEAFDYLEKIGHEGEYINEKAYLFWPLFNDIRKESKFVDLYYKFYEKDFNEQVKNELNKIL